MPMILTRWYNYNITFSDTDAFIISRYSSCTLSNYQDLVSTMFVKLVSRARPETYYPDVASIELFGLKYILPLYPICK